MMRLNAPRAVSLDGVSDIALALCGDSRQTHVGILLRNEATGQIEMLDLQTHLVLTLRSIEEAQWVWLECSGLSQSQRLQLADMLPVHARKNENKIPYSLGFDATAYFDEDGVTTGLGLTCATFVLATFRHFGFDLVDTSSWDMSPEDEEWQRRILAYFERNHVQLKMTLAYIESQRPLIGKATRFRPEQVAAAANLYAGSPIGYLEAVISGRAIKAAMLECLNPST
jgi:hypothetical protein